jgi:ABC-type multidrug transport system ATPase subunit
MPPPILRAEQIDIESEQRSVLADLRTGDFNKQRLACEQLSALAENHFPEFLSRSVNLISDANQLDDRIRERRITADEQGVEVRQLIASAVTLLTEMTNTTPVGRIPIDMMPHEERAISEARGDQIAATLSSRMTSVTAKPYGDEDADDAELIRFIVQTREPESQGKLIVVQDVTKTYSGSSFKLRPISLELNRGEILGIVGVNASGKTTLLRILLGELRQSSGDIWYPSLVDAVKKRDWIRVKQRIGYVSQILPRWPGSVYDNLCYVASIYGHPLREIDAYLEQLLKRYGLDKFKNATWDEISGGYKTRFEIVRALVSKPDILILDEPLAYLDIISQQVVLRQLRQLARNRARPIGVIISSQQLYEIESIANRLLVLEGGETLFSNHIKDLSTLIADLVVEFSATGSMMKIKAQLSSHPHYGSLFATETGYIAIFRRTIPVAGRSDSRIDFNDVLKLLGEECAGNLSYARDVSSSCRILFEPRMAEWLSANRRSQ